jgi:hypothetical protein
MRPHARIIALLFDTDKARGRRADRVRGALEPDPA